MPIWEVGGSEVVFTREPFGKKRQAEQAGGSLGLSIVLFGGDR